jgi:hypothetical protein
MLHMLHCSVTICIATRLVYQSDKQMLYIFWAKLTGLYQFDCFLPHYNKYLGVNFINVFTYKFLVGTSFRQLFLVTFWLWQKNLYEKRAQKTLMKLTVGQ